MILLTGATGYLGSMLLKSLTANGYEVVALKRKKSDCSRWKGLDRKFEIFTLGSASMEEIFRSYPIRTIIHTSVNYGRKGESVASIFDSNVLFPLKLIETGINQGVQAIYNTSTSLPPNLNAYSLSKFHFRQSLEMFKDLTKIIHVIPEYFYGPNEDRSKFVSMLVDRIEQKAKSIPLTSCQQKRDFFFIDDLVDGFLCLLTNETKIETNSSFELGSGTSIELKELVIKIAEMMGYENERLSFGALPVRASEIMESKADLTMMNELKWAPKVSLDEGLSKTIFKNSK